MMRPSNDMVAMLEITTLHIEDQVVAFKLDGSIPMDLPLLISTSMRFVLDDIGSLINSSLDIKHQTRMISNNVSIGVQLEALVFTTVIWPDDEFGEFLGRAAFNVQNKVREFMLPKRKLITLEAKGLPSIFFLPERK